MDYKSVPELLLAQGDIVLISESQAYDAFVRGFPLAEEGQSTGLRAFYEKHVAEFPGSFYGDGKFDRYFDANGSRFYFTFHRHRLPQEIMWKIG